MLGISNLEAPVSTIGVLGGVGTLIGDMGRAIGAPTSGYVLSMIGRFGNGSTIEFGVIHIGSGITVSDKCGNSLKNLAVSILFIFILYLSKPIVHKRPTNSRYPREW